MDYQEPHPDTLTRKGYLLKDLSRNFLQALSESGAVATGKLMHFSSDFIASGGLELWQKLCWDYAYDHIGVASPRIFYYLNKNFKELDQKSSKLSLDKFCRDPDVQQQVMECALILQMCPKKGKVKYPSVPVETHNNENWLRSVLRTTDKASVRKVWNSATDQEQLLHAGNEMIFAITEGAPERALYWAKWAQEEDQIMKKQYGSHLSTQDRGPATSKQRAHSGYYLIAVLAELYKEYYAKGMIRMNEEFQALLNLYRDQDTSQKHKGDIIAIMIQLLTEVPKWKVPAAPSLVQDSAGLQRVLQTSEHFFEELLRFPQLQKPLPSKVSGLKVAKKKDKDKQSELELKLAEIDRVTMGYLKM
jgi:hypothetical protein